MIYPEYFDALLTRAAGRRVPKDLTVNDPKLDEISNICRKLGLSPVIEVEKSHPAHWHGSRGRLKVMKRYPKETTLRMISERLAKRS